jgi:hypothetical protein
MKKLLLLLWLAVALGAGAQTTFSVCVSANKDGKCEGESHEFDLYKDGGTLTFLLYNAQSLGTTQVNYKIYRKSSSGSESYETTISQNIESNWNYSWKDIDFFDAGTYRIKVYDSSDYYITENTIQLFKP